MPVALPHHGHTSSSQLRSTAHSQSYSSTPSRFMTFTHVIRAILTCWDNGIGCALTCHIENTCMVICFAVCLTGSTVTADLQHGGFFNVDLAVASTEGARRHTVRSAESCASTCFQSDATVAGSRSKNLPMSRFCIHCFAAAFDVAVVTVG